MATAKTTKKEFNMVDVLAMWKKKSKSGKEYFSGKMKDGEYITGFYNTMKKNPKEPDVRIYLSKDMEEQPQPAEILSLWCNVSKGGKKYLTGKYQDKKVVGFINEKATEKQPYFTVYFSDSEPKKEEAVQQTTLEPVADANGDMPF